MKLNWNTEKDEILKRTRGISFSEIMEFGEILDVVENPNYPNQKRFIICYESYIYSVPFVENSDEIFLKTIIPSRKLMKKYSGEKKDEE